MRRRAVALAVVAVVAVVAVSLLGASIARASDDPDFASFQYGPQQIYAPEAWTVSRGEGVTIAIVDSGVQLDHPDLREKIVPGYDFADDDDDPSDDHGHGTHVAGIAAAVTDNGIGIAGVATRAKILPVRVPFGEGSLGSEFTNLTWENAIRFAVDSGAEVINLSIGEEGGLSPQGFDSLSTACSDAYARGSLCVAAAGNGGKSKPSGYNNDFPGLVVAANDRHREVAPFSQNADSQWAVTAPGVAIHSTWLDSGYSMQQGTSMAAPHVSGVAALLFAQGLTIQQVIDKILETATPLNDGGGMSGAGLVNAAAAVGAEFTPATTAPPRAATTIAVAAPSGPRPSGTATTVEDLGPAVLEEGEIEDGDLLDGASDFELALGEGNQAEPLSETDGFTASFLLLCGGFIAVIAVLGVAARPVLVRRGVGRIRERGGVA